MVVMPADPVLLIKGNSNYKPILKKYAQEALNPTRMVPSTAGSVRPTSARPASALVSQQRSRPASAPVSQPRTASVRGRATPQGTDQPQKLQMHWLAWDTGDLEPPGLQRQCHKPWPTPEPPVLPGDRTTGYVARGQSRPASARGTPSIPGASPAQTPSPPQNQQQCMAAGTSTVTGKTTSGKGTVKFHPHFRSWHSGTPNSYERNVTYNMLQHLYGGKAGQLDKMRRQKPGRYEHPINFERRIINETYRSLQSPREFYGNFYGDSKSIKRIGGGRSSNNTMSLQKAPVDYYPVSVHNSARSGPAVRTDMTVSSHFQLTTPSVRGSFVIHPDFVSEHCEFSRNLRHLKAAGGSKGFQYGSASR